MRCACVLTVAAVVLSACGMPGEATSRSSVADSAGIAIISNGEQGAAGTFTVRETLRLGVLEEEGPEQFSEIYAVAMNESGDVFVGNNGSGTIRVFDSEGTFLVELGGRGQGPGEVNMVNEVVASGDTVAIIDFQRGGKVALYSVDGTLLSSWSVMQVDRTRIQPLHPTPEGWLTRVSRAGEFPRPGPGEVATLFQDIHLADFGSTDIGAPVYTIPLYTLYGLNAEGEWAQDWSLFRPLTHSGFDSEGRLYVTHDQAYRIDVHDPQGLRRSIRRTYTPRPLTQTDVADLKAAALQVVDTLSEIPDEYRARQRTSLDERIDRQATLPLPDVMTPLGGILVSPEGSFWVEVVNPETLIEREAAQTFGGFGRMPREETEWDLFDTEGQFLGTATLPARFRAEAVRGREVVGVWADELDVEYVIRYEAIPVG